MTLRELNKLKRKRVVEEYFVTPYNMGCEPSTPYSQVFVVIPNVERQKITFRKKCIGRVVPELTLEDVTCALGHAYTWFSVYDVHTRKKLRVISNG